jgi:hypothetical protein
MGKLFAAVGLGITGWIGSEIIRSVMPPHTDFGAFNIVNVILGLMCGWVVAGTRLGYGYRQGVAAGLTGAAALVFWAVIIQSFSTYNCFLRSKPKRIRIILHHINFERTTPESHISPPQSRPKAAPVLPT